MEYEKPADSPAPYLGELLEKYLYVTYPHIVTPNVGAFTAMNCYDCLLPNVASYIQELKENFGRCSDAFFHPMLYYTCQKNEEIEGQMCLVRCGKLACGIETDDPIMIPDFTDPDEGVWLEHPLYAVRGETMVLCKVLFDLDNGEVTYVCQHVHLCGPGQTITGEDRDKYPDITKKATWCL